MDNMLMLYSGVCLIILSVSIFHITGLIYQNEMSEIKYKDACNKLSGDGFPIRDNNNCLAGKCEVDFDKDGFETTSACIASICSINKFGIQWQKYCDFNYVALNETVVN